MHVVIFKKICLKYSLGFVTSSVRKVFLFPRNDLI